MSNTNPTPKFCCYCGKPNLRNLETWQATSDSEPDNTDTVTEFQCANEGEACESASFWA